MPSYGTCGNGFAVVETTDVVVAVIVAVVVDVTVWETSELTVDWSAEIVCS